MRTRARARAAALAAAALAAAAAQPEHAGAAALSGAARSEDVIFRDALGDGWREGGTAWSWSGAAGVAPGRGRGGGAALCAALDGWGGASLVRRPSAPPLPPESLLVFWLAPARRGAPALNLTAMQLVRSARGRGRYGPEACPTGCRAQCDALSIRRCFFHSAHAPAPARRC
jgi:hypothetical protein